MGLPSAIAEDQQHAQHMDIRTLRDSNPHAYNFIRARLECPSPRWTSLSGHFHAPSAIVGRAQAGLSVYSVPEGVLDFRGNVNVHGLQ